MLHPFRNSLLDSEHSNSWEETIITAAGNIEQQVNRLKCLRRLPLDININFLSFDELIESETVGRNLYEHSQVLVHALEPMEKNFAFAKRVYTNMQQDVKYHYFYDIREHNAVHIVTMLRSLMIACLDGIVPDISSWDNLIERQRLSIMQEHASTIRNNLRHIQYQLFVHFIPHKMSEQFCLHNAESSNYRRGYLRWFGRRNYFLQLDRQEAEIKFEAYQYFMHHSDPTIFGSTNHVPVSQIMQEGMRLEAQLQRMFPENLVNDVKQVFFETT